MTRNDLQTIKESIERTKRFGVGYPKLITDVDERWRKFFQKEYEWCLSHAKALGLSPDEISMKNTVLDL